MIYDLVRREKPLPYFRKGRFNSELSMEMLKETKKQKRNTFTRQ